MKKVIGFDSWTGGSRFFVRLVPTLREHGYELELLHLGSWGGDAGRPKEERIEGLRVRDVSAFDGKNFLRILDDEKPAAVIFLSVDTFAHRAFHRYCKWRGIPTLQLYHGLVSVQEVTGTHPYKTNLVAHVRFVLPRLMKAFVNVWPAYLGSLARTRARPAEWARFVSDVYNLGMSRFIVVSAEDARATRCGVYTSADVAHAVAKYGYRERDVHAVGNPDLVSFGFSEADIGHGLDSGRSRDRRVVYIDTGLIYTGAVYTDAEAFLEHLAHTQEMLKTQGIGFAVKLHPQHYRTDFPKRLADIGIEVVSNENFVEVLKRSEAAIVEPSTAGLIPAILGVPLLLAAYGPLADQKYGGVLARYPRAMVLDDPNRITAQLEAEAKGVDIAAVKSWISENTGPLPSENMPQRVAEILKEITGDQ